MDTLQKVWFLKKWKTQKVRVFDLKYEVFTEISAIMSTKYT